MAAEAKSPRYAIYYAPAAADPLSFAAADWLGRDAFSGDSRAPEIPSRIAAEPRRYGFHATLKAPFRLAPGVEVAALEEAMQVFAEKTQAVPIGQLQIGQISDFFVLKPADAGEEIGQLAGEVVEAFDAFRAPLNASELQRRKSVALSERELSYLESWGYPYVFDLFRFHMTLTGPVSPAEADALAPQVERRFGALLDRPYAIDALTLFVQDSPDADFRAAARFPLRQARSVTP